MCFSSYWAINIKCCPPPPPEGGGLPMCTARKQEDCAIGYEHEGAVPQLLSSRLLGLQAVKWLMETLLCIVPELNERVHQEQEEDIARRKAAQEDQRRRVREWIQKETEEAASAQV